MGTPKNVEGHQYPFLGSFNNITFDDFIEKHLDNSDHELLKNVISAEECRITQNPSSSSSSSSSPPIFHGNLNASSRLRNKAIDDVWSDIVSQENANAIPAEMIYKGDLTLNNFVTHKGATNAFCRMSKIDHDQWQQEQVIMPMPVQAVIGSKFDVSESCENKVMNLGYLDDVVQSVAMMDKSSESQSQTENKRAFTDKLMAKTIERRQRRMIKNRESAARSRARKQAYTNQLQHTLLRLQTANNWLKKKKDLEMQLDSSLMFAPRYQLRRTSSNTF